MAAGRGREIPRVAMRFLHADADPQRQTVLAVRPLRGGLRKAIASTRDHSADRPREAHGFVARAHPDHQLRVNRTPANLAVEDRQLVTKLH